MASASSQTRESKELKTKEELQHLVDSYDNWLFDCDGASDWLLSTSAKQMSAVSWMDKAC
jgi:hypothetical protein